MPAQTRCSACQKFDDRQENFCRVCGFEFYPDAPERPRVEILYSSSEKYCGNCGCTIGNCDCRS